MINVTTTLCFPTTDDIPSPVINLKTGQPVLDPNTGLLVSEPVLIFSNLVEDGPKYKDCAIARLFYSNDSDLPCFWETDSGEILDFNYVNSWMPLSKLVNYR